VWLRILIAVGLVLSGGWVPQSAHPAAAVPVTSLIAGPTSGLSSVAAKGTLTADPATTAPKAGKKFVVSGQASAGKKGWKVRIQARKVGKARWSTIGSTRTTTGGKYRTRVKLGVGAWELRAKAIVTRGPVSEPVQVTSMGRVRKVKLRKATVVVPVSHIAQVGAVTGDGSQRVTFTPGRELPPVGAVVTMNASASVPDGVLGRVKAVDPAARTVILGQAALSEAYSTYRVSAVATLGDVAVAAAGLNPQVRAQALLAVSRVGFECNGVVNPLTAATVDMSGVRASFDFDMRSRFMSLLLVGNPKFDLGFKLGGALKTTCGAQMVATPIPLGASGLILTVTPQITLTIGAEGAAEFSMNAEGRFANGFAKAGNQPVVYTKAMKFNGAPTVPLAAKVSTELGAGLEVAIMVGGRAGVYGEAGPALLGELTVRDGPQACVWLGTALNFGLGVKVDLFIVDWKWELGTFQWKMPTIYDTCLVAGVPVSPPSAPSPPPPNPTVAPATPPVPSPSLSIARSSGPAGFGTNVQGFSCPVAPVDKPRLQVVSVSPEGHAISVSGITGPVGSMSVTTEYGRPVGAWNYAIQCRYSSEDDPTAFVVGASFPVALTVTGPPLSLLADTSAVTPGQTVTISDGGGCGPWEWGQVRVRLAWPSDTTAAIVSELPIDAAGRWGPLTVTLPAISLNANDVLDVSATCGTAGWPPSWIHYQSLQIPAAAQQG
jgi:hypothetical protein